MVDLIRNEPVKSAKLAVPIENNRRESLSPRKSKHYRGISCKYILNQFMNNMTKSKNKFKSFKVIFIFVITE